MFFVLVLDFGIDPQRENWKLGKMDPLLDQFGRFFALNLLWIQDIGIKVPQNTFTRFRISGSIYSRKTDHFGPKWIHVAQVRDHFAPEHIFMYWISGSMYWTSGSIYQS